jgi:SAM-dependent methyltransferase
VYGRERVSHGHFDTERWPRHRIEALAFLAGRGESFLEIGCGDGEVLRLVSSNFDFVAGVELSPNRVTNAQEALSGLQTPHSIAAGNVEERLPFDDGAFDCIGWADVLEHVVDVWAAMAEVSRLLADGGRLVTITPNIAGIRKRVTLLAGRFPSTSAREEGLGVRSGELFDGGHLHYFTYRSVEELYRRFSIRPVRRIGFGRFGRLHHIRPTILSGSVAVVGEREPRPR